MLHLLPTAGESSAAYHELALALSDKHNVTLCTYFKSNVSCPKEITLFEGDSSLKGFFPVLKAALEAKEYDIIHVHTPFLGFFFLVCSVFMFGRLMPSTVYTVHSSYPNYKPRNRLMLMLIFRFFQTVVCCSKASFESFPAFFKWLAGNRICAVRNSVDIDRIDRVIGNRRRYPQKDDNFTVAVVGRLIESKNLTTVLRAFQQSDDQASQLVLIGAGYLKNVLVAQSQELGIGKRVKFTGLIPKEKVYENLIKVDLLLSASRVEGLPIAALEAMACRCPVILSDIPSHREIAAGADFIPLIHPDDVTGFAQEIKRFRQMSSLERAEIGEKAREIVEERFSLIRMHEGYRRVYAQVLGLASS